MYVCIYIYIYIYTYTYTHTYIHTYTYPLQPYLNRTSFFPPGDHHAHYRTLRFEPMIVRTFLNEQTGTV